MPLHVSCFYYMHITWCITCTITCNFTSYYLPYYMDIPGFMCAKGQFGLNSGPGLGPQRGHSAEKGLGRRSRLPWSWSALGVGQRHRYILRSTYASSHQVLHQLLKRRQCQSGPPALHLVKHRIDSS